MIAEKEKTITISTFDENGKPFRYGGEKVEVALSLLGSKDPPIKGNVVDNNDGTYVATFTPSACGEHKLSISVENQAVKGSPFLLHVRQPRNYDSISSAQGVFQTSSNPLGVAVDDKGDVYVAAFNGHFIDVFNQHGTKLRTISSSGSGDGQCNRPTDVALQGDVLYIVDQDNHRVQKLTISGQFISKFGTPGSEDGQLNSPRGICLDQDGRVFVSEYSGNRVSVFESDGSFAYHVTASNLNNPWGLTFDPSGNLHVCNYGSNYVSIFTPEGRYISQYASQVSGPAGIQIDEEGYTFIAEHHNGNGSYNNSRFSVLTTDHQLIRHVKNFNYAGGIATDKEGFIYVCCFYSNCVYKY